MAEAMLERLEDLENYPEENLTPYKEFELDGETYSFTPGDSSTARTRVRTRLEVSSAATSPTRFGTTGATTDR